LLHALKRAGLYDRSVIFVGADHGVSFRRRQPPREPSEGNAEDILSVPFFVKRAHQRSGRVVARAVRTVDAVPTIADLLGVRLPYKSDGQSVFDRSYRTHSRLTVVGTDRDVTLSTQSFIRRRDAAVRRMVSMFGARDRVPGVYCRGPYRQLCGRRLAAFRPALDRRVEGAPRARIHLERASLRGPIVPARFAGHLTGPGLRSGHWLGLALNGRIVAITSAVRAGTGAGYAIIVPDSALSEGDSRVALFAISGRTKKARIRLFKSG
jgi:hypothetical protein